MSSWQETRGVYPVAATPCLLSLQQGKLIWQRELSVSFQNQFPSVSSHPYIYNYIWFIKTRKSIEDVLFFSGGKAAQCDVQMPVCLHSHLAVRHSESTPRLQYSASPPIIWPPALEITTPGMKKKKSVELWSMKESIRYSLCWGHRASGHVRRCFYVLLISNIVFHWNMNKPSSNSITVWPQFIE